MTCHILAGRFQVVLFLNKESVAGKQETETTLIILSGKGFNTRNPVFKKIEGLEKGAPRWSPRNDSQNKSQE